MNPIRVLLTLGMAAIGIAALAEVRLPMVFGDNMVLQREREIPVWGWAAPGEEVTAELNHAQAVATADADGAWSLRLPAMTAGGPYRLTVKGRENTLERSDVLIGDVWLCSGQSNMDFPLKNAIGGLTDATGNTQIRFFRVAYRQSAERWNDLHGDPDREIEHWVVCTPETAANFAGIGYYFGTRLQQELGVPIGLIGSYRGATMAESWIPDEGFAQVPELHAITEWLDAKKPGSPVYERLTGQWRKAQQDYQAALDAAIREKRLPPEPPVFPEALRAMDTSDHPDQPVELYNAMIHPLTPYALRGVLWYQGEYNVRQGSDYIYRLAALDRGWKRQFAHPELPFFIVQLAPFDYGPGVSPDCLPAVMAAQAAYAAENPTVHLAVINDVGVPNNIHPPDKRTVGLRLADLALKYEYGRATIAADSPEIRRQPESEEGKLILVFDQELTTADGKTPNWFEVAGADGKFHPAAAVLDGSRVILSAPEVPLPTQVRFAWNQVAEPNLRGKSGLPVGPFRSQSTVGTTSPIR